MAWSLDARIPVKIAEAAPAPAGAVAVIREAGGPPAPEDAALVAEFTPLPAHAAACVCCGGRPAAAPAFDRLFLARVRGDCAWFERVLAIPATKEGRSALAAALRDDAATSARFRLSGWPVGAPTA